MTGDLLYRCRLCGAVYPARNVPDFATTVAIVAGMVPAMEDWGPPDLARLETDLYLCADGCRGVADIVGSRPTPAERE